MALSGECSVDEKASNAANMGAVALIVVTPYAIVLHGAGSAGEVPTFSVGNSARNELENAAWAG
eukprot:CAMPEP_0196773834 /NCGR_PEP_ID=MMETSP1104-20130614/3011_1 /TAXON_ID=33652 /ORGANISM="Cafeteria sp., Strain Caron Lab Isolate" /LENGTH=63 /DNA_ID=CAMNT_0042143985 /DNA_START=159 /DNA_END=346 /DNA_ORIENTATION=+